MGEIHSEEGGCGGCGRASLEEGKGHVARAAAQVEDEGVGPAQDVAEGAGRAPPPEAVDADGKEVIEEVIAAGDGVEHLLYVGGGVLVGDEFLTNGPRTGDEFVIFCGYHAGSFPRYRVAARMSSSMDRVAASSSSSLTSKTTWVEPIPVGRMKARRPLRFFLSDRARATS